MNKDNFIVTLFYKFTPIKEPLKLKEEQQKLAGDLNLTGRILISEEGINATLEGKKEEIESYQKALRSDERFSDIVFKDSEGTGDAFPKLKVKVRPEIVTLGVEGLNPKKDTAKKLQADELEKWYEKDEDFVVLDLRNDYEIASGYFDKTIDPGLKNFRDLPAKMSELEKFKDKKIVTVCTGGIRCEKATCLFKKKGFKDVYQLEDGIYTYMMKYPQSHFKGTLFVFDNRMVTPVKEEKDREVVGKCLYCDSLTEEYANDDSITPSRKILCCSECFEKKKDNLRPSVG